jgi:hypothetical protein
MALGEYVSVSTQRDTERALLSKERGELREDPAAELDELAALYEAKGLSTATARTVAEELTDHDAFAAHAEVELGIDPDDLTNPWQAALSSAVSLTVAALLPLNRNPVAAHHSPSPGDRRGSAHRPVGRRCGVGTSGRGTQATRSHTQYRRRWPGSGHHLCQRTSRGRRDHLSRFAGRTTNCYVGRSQHAA